MRQHIDLAVLDLPVHRAWLDSLLLDLAPHLVKVRLHRIPWGQAAETEQNGPAYLDQRLDQPSMQTLVRHLEQPHGTNPGPGTDFFLRSQVQLRRFDALLLPASLATLGWTRQTLASAPRGPMIPVIGVLDELRSGAILDLLALGMTDFVTTQTDGQSFRARLIHAISRAPRTLGVREAAAGVLSNPATVLASRVKTPARQSTRTAGCAGCYLHISSLGWPDQGFGPSKQRLVTLFEKQYLQAALKRTNGNITAAASNSLKNRRAFWELLRKHGLVSRAYATETGEDETPVSAVTRVKFDTESETGMHSDISES